MPSRCEQLPDRFVGTQWQPPDRQEEEEALRLATPEVVVAALSPVLGPARAARLDEVVAARLGGLTVVLERLHDPHNGAAALRSCEAAGLIEVHVVEQGEPFRVSPRVTQGCDKWLDVVRHDSSESCLEELRRRGFGLYAAVPGANQQLETLDPRMPAAFVLGNEHEGLSMATRAACDAEISIPLWGFSRSLNLSVAAALLVHTHAARRRQALGRAGDLSEREQLHLRARYYARDVRGAAGIVQRYLTRACPPPG
ncbi:MAG: RNA methyltransferase [Myxococcales bacterium]|nr:RNA methyltransferase [Myxococcota bacterium]MDW8282576.1 RNA methyltransferase [Myxococcales bacterium]